MGVVWVHWLMARGQILKESLVPLAPPYRERYKYETDNMYYM